jgi:hypothetical protein
MSIEELRSYRNRKPFEPFSIVMEDGRTLEVERPERLALSHRGHEASLFHGKHLSFLPMEKIRRVDHITRGSAQGFS